MNAGPVNLRNLERIQEGVPTRWSRWSTLFLALSGSVAIGAVGFAMRSHKGPPKAATVDPLTVLVAEAQAKKAPVNEIVASEVTFPEVLSDSEARTTALVSVKDKSGKLVAAETEAEPEDSAANDAALEQLPVVPLPAGTLLGQTKVSTGAEDELMRISVHASEVPSDAPLAEPGSEGGFMIQVASFQQQEDADAFAQELRRRGHRAFRQAANVPGRGVWHRVRVGSFKTKYEAGMYKKKLEDVERVTALVIDPEKVERQEQARAQKLAERIEKSKSE